MKKHNFFNFLKNHFIWLIPLFFLIILVSLGFWMFRSTTIIEINTNLYNIAPTALNISISKAKSEDNILVHLNGVVSLKDSVFSNFGRNTFRVLDTVDHKYHSVNIANLTHDSTYQSRVFTQISYRDYGNANLNMSFYPHWMSSRELPITKNETITSVDNGLFISSLGDSIIKVIKPKLSNINSFALADYYYTYHEVSNIDSLSFGTEVIGNLFDRLRFDNSVTLFFLFSDPESINKLIEENKVAIRFSSINILTTYKVTPEPDILSNYEFQYTDPKKIGYIIKHGININGTSQSMTRTIKALELIIPIVIGAIISILITILQNKLQSIDNKIDKMQSRNSDRLGHRRHFFHRRNRRK